MKAGKIITLSNGDVVKVIGKTTKRKPKRRRKKHVDKLLRRLEMRYEE